eukprot:2379603-Pleurochrysis_carterae.AAC.1
MRRQCRSTLDGHWRGSCAGGRPSDARRPPANHSKRTLPAPRHLHLSRQIAGLRARCEHGALLCAHEPRSTQSRCTRSRIRRSAACKQRLPNPRQQDSSHETTRAKALSTTQGRPPFKCRRSTHGHTHAPLAPVRSPAV